MNRTACFITILYEMDADLISSSNTKNMIVSYLQI